MFGCVISLLLKKFFFRRSVLIFVPLCCVLGGAVSVGNGLLTFLLAVTNDLTVSGLVSCAPCVICLAESQRARVDSFACVFTNVSVLFVVF